MASNNSVDVFRFTSSISQDIVIEMANQKVLNNWHYIYAPARYYIPIQYKDDAEFMDKLKNVEKIFRATIENEIFDNKYFVRIFKGFNTYMCQIVYNNTTFNIYWASNFENASRK